jgi:hypothetical protein
LNEKGLALSDHDENMADVKGQMDEAVADFQEAIKTEDPAGIVREFGEMVTAFGHATGDFGDGMGELLEDSAQKAFGSEEFGSGFFPELGEGVMSVLGEFAEGTAEATSRVGEAFSTAVGGVIESVGSAGEHLWDAGGDIAEGDIGGAVRHVVDGVGDVAGGVVGAAVDTGGALLGAAGEVVEGIGGMAYEAGEAAVEMVAGGVSDVIDVGEDVVDFLNPFD